MQEDIIEHILPTNPADSKNCQMEVLSASGGSESSLFAGDLVDMYTNYCRVMGFNFKQEDLMVDQAINRGCKSGLFTISGVDVYKHLKHESGVHKVQRVPETE